MSVSLSYLLYDLDKLYDFSGLFFLSVRKNSDNVKRDVN